MKRVQHCAVRWSRPGEYVEYMVGCIWLRAFLCDRSVVALLETAVVGCFVTTGRQSVCGSPARDQRLVVSCMEWLRVVEMFFCESAIRSGALGAIPFGKAGATRCHIVIVHERLQVQPHRTGTSVGAVVLYAPANLTLCPCRLQSSDLPRPYRANKKDGHGDIQTHGRRVTNAKKRGN